MVEDLVTTGLSSREDHRGIRAAGGEWYAPHVIVDRSGGGPMWALRWWPWPR